MKKLTIATVISTIILYLIFSVYNGVLNINEWEVKSHDWFMTFIYSDLIALILIFAFKLDKKIDKIVNE